MTTRMTLAALVLSALGAPALAQDAPAPEPAPAPGPERAGPRAEAPNWFGGRLTEAERSALMQQRFASADANGDGQLSPEEVVAAVEAAVEAERRERIQRMFDALDADDSGTLSLAELEEARPMFGERGGPRGRDGRDGPGGPGGPRPDRR